MNRTNSTAGTVAFVGAGPGDDDLLTLRGARRLGTADVVVFDSTGPSRVLEHCHGEAESIDATGAEPAEIMVAAAAAGKSVVRLCHGDPGLSRGLADEARACVEAGLSFEIVPGPCEVSAVPAYAGILLATARGSEIRVVDPAEVGLDWDSYGGREATLVIPGAQGSVGQIAKALVAAGRGGSTPIAVIYRGTTTNQRTVVSTLGDVGTDLRSGTAAGDDDSCVVVVGDAVDLRTQLSWFETRSLFGWRVLVPRTKEQAGSMSEQLRSHGAVPEEVPTISVEPPRTPQQMERAVKGLVTGRYEWVAFTSVNAVKAVRERVEQYGLDARSFAGLKVAAVGEQTSAALVEFGIRPDLTPSGQQSSDGLVDVWPPYDADLDPINRVLAPRADIATDTLVAGLTELGWEVDDVTAYRTVRAAPPPAPTREAIKGGGFDAVLFTSSSTVRNLIGIAGKPHAATVIGVIGPQTARTAEEFGLRVDVMAEEPSVRSLAEGLARYGADHRQAAVDAGEMVHRPSQMRRGARRRAK